MTGPRQAGFIPALDGLRGIAILLVMLHHFTFYRPTAGIDLAFGSVVFFWWTGVDLFFVLSGFLITGILLDTRRGSHYFTAFYARRILRILPLYYLVLFLAFVLVPKSPALQLSVGGQADLPPQWPYWSFMTNIWIAKGGWTNSWADVSWSLAIEEHFYLVWPLLIWLCPPRLIALLCAAIIVAEPLARIYARESGMESLPIYVLTWFRLDGLAIGALLALAQRRGLLPALDRWAPLVSIATVAGLIVCTVMGGHTWWWNRWMQQYGYSLIAIGGGAMLVSAVNRPAGSLWPRMLTAGWLRAFGRYSYCLYLIHPPIGSLVQDRVFNPANYEVLGMAPWIAQLIYYVIAIAPAFAVAWLSWRFFEAPILKLKAWFPLDRSTSPAYRR